MSRLADILRRTGDLVLGKTYAPIAVGLLTLAVVGEEREEHLVRARHLVGLLGGELELWLTRIEQGVSVWEPRG